MLMNIAAIAVAWGIGFTVARSRSRRPKLVQLTPLPEPVISGVNPEEPAKVLPVAMRLPEHLVPVTELSWEDAIVKEGETALPDNLADKDYMTGELIVCNRCADGPGQYFANEFNTAIIVHGPTVQYTMGRHQCPKCRSDLWFIDDLSLEEYCDRVPTIYLNVQPPANVRKLYRNPDGSDRRPDQATELQRRISADAIAAYDLNKLLRNEKPAPN